MSALGKGAVGTEVDTPNRAATVGKRLGSVRMLPAGGFKVTRSPWQLNCSHKSKMIWLAVILMFLWLVGLATAYTLGGFLHILLVLSITVLVIQFTMGHREA
jgi:hypothetical protein